MVKNPTPTKTAATYENPRTSRIRDVVLSAVLDLVLAEGAGAVTVLRVSEHAEVARSTIYQHWPDQQSLLLDAIDRISAPDLATAITGNLEADLDRALSTLRRRITVQPFRAVFATLLDHANRDRDFVAAQRRFVRGVLQPIRDILTASVQHGDLPVSLDVDEAVARLADPLFTQHIMLRATISDEIIATTVTQFLCQKR